MDSHDYGAFASDLHGLHGMERYDAFGAELANCEAELSEFEQQAVQSYWDQVIAEELGTSAMPNTPFVWSELGAGERTRLRRAERREANATLRLIAAEAEEAA